MDFGFRAVDLSNRERYVEGKRGYDCCRSDSDEH